jgi:predicted XRE-type DNA-binding protein
MKFPSKQQIEKAMKILENAPGSRLLPKNASPGDVLKYDLCKRFIVYRREEELSQKDLAESLGIDPAQMSKILHYHIDEFSVDFLLSLLIKIRPKTTIRVDEAS